MYNRHVHFALSIQSPLLSSRYVTDNSQSHRWLCNRSFHYYWAIVLMVTLSHCNIAMCIHHHTHTIIQAIDFALPATAPFVVWSAIIRTIFVGHCASRGWSLQCMVYYCNECWLRAALYVNSKKSRGCIIPQKRWKWKCIIPSNAGADNGRDRWCLHCTLGTE